LKERIEPKPKRGIRITIIRVPSADAKTIMALGECLLECLRKLKLYESNPSSKKAVLFIEPFEYAIDYNG